MLVLSILIIPLLVLVLLCVVVIGSIGIGLPTYPNQSDQPITRVDETDPA